MATCKDCIHYYVCNSKGANCREDIGFGSDVIFITESLKAEEQCDEFFPDIVRCKDCKSFGKFGSAFVCSELGDRVRENDFCSRGKRMDGEGE